MEGEIGKGLLGVIKDEMKPALGVTEPVAVALASSKAYQLVGGEVKEISITTDPALFKTGVACVVPGTDETGFAMAAVLGVVVGDPSLGMEVLKNVDGKSVAKAKSLLRQRIAHVAIKKEQAGIYVEAVVKTSDGVGRVVIEDKHDQIVLLEANGEAKYQQEVKGGEQKQFDITSLKVSDLISFAREVPFEDIEFVLDSVRLNRELAQEGLTNWYGMGVGLAMTGLLKENKIADDLVTSAQILVAAACDARIGGAQKAAMSIAGSGSHGITATLPIAAVAERMGIGEEKLARSIALSLLLTVYIKAFSGRLSAFCGCAVTAASGAAAGIVFLMGGDEGQVGSAIKNIAADVTGIICDGGNAGCALKTSTGAGAAIRAALLAMKGVVIPACSGIVGKDVEETIRGMGQVSSPGMLETDKVILDIIANR